MQLPNRKGRRKMTAEQKEAARVGLLADYVEFCGKHYKGVTYQDVSKMLLQDFTTITRNIAQLKGDMEGQKHGKK